MKLSVLAKPGAKAASVVEKEGLWMVAVKERAADGRANRAVERAIAAHFGIAPSRVCIVAGQAARRKIVEIKQ